MKNDRKTDSRDNPAGAPRDTGRRTVLKGLLIAPVVGACGASCASRYRGKVLSARPASDGSFVVKTSQLASLKSPKDAIFVDAPGYAKKISLRKLADGTYVALMMKCTHWGCTVDPLPEGNLCPCHGAQYDLQGKVIRGPAKKPLKRLAVTVVPDGVRVARP